MVDVSERKTMDLNNKTVVVTGGARGIGKALCKAFSVAGARVVVADQLIGEAEAVACAVGGLGVACNVSNESDIRRLVDTAEREFGPIDLFCSNAGICFGEPDHSASASNEVWQACWDIHVMAHVYAARAVLPSMLARGDGYFLQMASAAGLLSQIGDAAYSASKHAAVGFAESLSISHGDEGIKVSVICPQYVATPMLGYQAEDCVDPANGVISAEQLAESVMRGIEEERFLILPHPEVEQYIQAKSANYSRWITGMRKLRRGILARISTTRVEEMHKLILNRRA